MTRLEPDRNELERFLTLFKHAGDCPEHYVSMRGFRHKDGKPIFIRAVSMSGGAGFLLECAADYASRAANYPEPVTFAPPICTFRNRDRAGEADLARGLVLSVECDTGLDAALAKLEAVLGPATVAVLSGGKMATGEPKGHGHWRLSKPVVDALALADLKQARDWACRLVGGDPTTIPVCHPLAWPGSWHTKAQPVLRVIRDYRPDVEIDLTNAAEKLRAAMVGRGLFIAPPGARTSSEDWKRRQGVCTEGHRTNRLTQYTGHLLRKDVNVNVITELMHCWNEVHCSPPLPEEKVTKTVNSLARREVKRRTARS